MFKCGKVILVFITASVAVLQPAFRVRAQETSSEFRQLQTLLEAKKWDDADRETVSLLRNNPTSCPNLRAIDQLWMQHSNNKYGLTPQLEIWQKTSNGLNCKTCEGEIKEFSEKVGWKLGPQATPMLGDFPAQYPTVAALGWQSYVDGDATMQILFGTRNTWQAWKVQGYNLFSTFANCGK
ncbi:GUN4 domain-containing protein [Microcoleus sp. MON2_D5]|uniref:GUN4 domain-containing protein n=1 Tax=Microcoleus sp. MON2_D5 TaxID=2818833 RepID=UPI002FD1A948